VGQVRSGAAAAQGRHQRDFCFGPPRRDHHRPARAELRSYRSCPSTSTRSNQVPRRDPAALRGDRGASSDEGAYSFHATTPRWSRRTRRCTRPTADLPPLRPELRAVLADTAPSAAARPTNSTPRRLREMRSPFRQSDYAANVSRRGARAGDDRPLRPRPGRSTPRPHSIAEVSASSACGEPDARRSSSRSKPQPCRSSCARDHELNAIKREAARVGSPLPSPATTRPAAAAVHRSSALSDSRPGHLRRARRCGLRLARNREASTSPA